MGVESVHIYTYIHIHIHIYIYRHTHTYILDSEPVLIKFLLQGDYGVHHQGYKTAQ
jgi:hypothetical protein